MSGAPQNEDHKNRVQTVTEQRTSHRPELLCRYSFLYRLAFRHSGKHTGILTFSCTDQNAWRAAAVVL